MTRMFNKCLAEKYGLLPGSKPPEPVKEPKNKGKGKKSTPVVNNVEEETKNILDEAPMTIIQSMQIGLFAINRIINELKPRYVILYDSEIGVVRQLEVFQVMLANHDFVNDN